MTSIDAEHATDGGHAAEAEQVMSKVDGIVNQLSSAVWTLLKSGREDRLDLALMLVQARASEFWEAWREEYAGIAAPVQEEREMLRTCLSLVHTRPSCAQALAEGELEEGQEFCPPCAEEHLDTPVAPTLPGETGSVVHIVTSVGATKVTTGPRQPAEARAS